MGCRVHCPALEGGSYRYEFERHTPCAHKNFRSPFRRVRASRIAVRLMSVWPRDLTGSSGRVRSHDVGWLFYRYGLCQVTRLVHVTPAPYRDVVGQQLQRHDFHDGRQQLGSGR